MDIILIQDVKTLGKKGDVVKVNDGYARNFILPKKLGIEATAKNINDLKFQKKAEEKKQQELLDDAKMYAKQLEEINIELSLKVGEGGRTFGSISTKEIANAVKEQFSIEIDRKKIQMAEPIKAIGSYKIAVKLHQSITAELKVEVKEA